MEQTSKLGFLQGTQVQGNKKKILVVMSSADELCLQSGKVVDTGFFLNELLEPARKLLSCGYELVFANPKGNCPQMDESSNSSLWFGLSGEKLEQAKVDLNGLLNLGLRTPRRLESFTEGELEQYAGLFIPGGHAPMVDLVDDLHLGRILNHFHQNRKPTACICHGPVGLLSAQDAITKQWTYRGYRMTCYSNVEELMTELKWFGKTPYKVADKLQAHGAILDSSSVPMKSNVIVDRELITGQGPTSAHELAERFVDALHRQQLAGSEQQRLHM